MWSIEIVVYYDLYGVELLRPPLAGGILCAGVRYACKGAHSLFTGQRERKRERLRESERE